MTFRWEGWLERVGGLFEVCVLLGMALLGVLMMPFFLLWTWVKGDPFWRWTRPGR